MGNTRRRKTTPWDQRPARVPHLGVRPERSPSDTGRGWRPQSDDDSSSHTESRRLVLEDVGTAAWTGQAPIIREAFAVFASQHSYRKGSELSRALIPEVTGNGLCPESVWENGDNE